MAYSGENPLSWVCLFNCPKSGNTDRQSEAGDCLTRLIGTGDEIVPLSQEEIDLLLRMGSDSQLVEMSSGIIENDRVQVLSGPLKGMEGSIRKIDRHKRMAYLEVEMFGRTVEMKVGLEIVSKKGNSYINSITS